MSVESVVGGDYKEKLNSLINSEFIPAGYTLTRGVELYPTPESKKYEALLFGINNKNVVYRKANVTPDRPGAFLAVWQRPVSPCTTKNKPIPLHFDELDYLFVQVQEHSGITCMERKIKKPKSGIFIFPVSILIEKGVVSSDSQKGKTGFRVFPPWSQDRGVLATKVFSASGKKTQRWQLPFFIEINENGVIDSCKLEKLFRLDL